MRRLLRRLLRRTSSKPSPANVTPDSKWPRTESAWIEIIREMLFCAYLEPNAPWKRAVVRRKQAEAVNHNETQSLLYQLPPELLLEIDDVLEGSTALALRASSRKFRVILGRGSEAQGVGEEAKKHFRELVAKDEFHEACSLEHRGKGSRSLRVCASCMKLHPVRMFSPEQLKEMPESRVCAGKEGKFRMCEHMQFSYDELMSRVPNGWHSTIAHCPSPDHAIEDGEKPPSIKRFGPFLEFSYRKLLFAVDEHQNVTFGMLRHALATIDWPICRHTRLNDPEIFHEEYGSYTKPANEETMPWYQYGQCKTQRCGTEFMLLLLPHYRLSGHLLGSHSLYLCVDRHMEPLTDPNSPDWLAQIDPPFLETKDKEAPLQRAYSSTSVLTMVSSIGDLSSIESHIESLV